MKTKMLHALVVTFAITAVSTASMEAVAQSAPQAKTCVFYEHINYTGKQFALYEGDVLVTRDNVKTDSVYPGKGKRRFVAPEWTGKVSGVKVPPNCTAYVSIGKGVGEYPTDMSLFNGDTNDKGEAFGCKCK